MDVWTDFPERFQPGEELFVGHPDDPSPSPVTIVASRPHRDRILLHLANVRDRSEASLLTNLVLMVPTAAAMPLDADTYYHHELVGLAAVLDDGSLLGEVVEVIETGAADVLVVHGPQGERLLPMLGTVIRAVDLPAGRITVTPLPGLLD